MTSLEGIVQRRGFTHSRQSGASRRLATAVLLILAVVSGSPLVADSNRLAHGTWSKKTQSASGTWKIVEDDGYLKLVASSEFKTKKAPDLKIFLSPLKADQAGNENATTKSLLVGRLPTVKGGFEIELPVGTDLDEYASILIHCDKYSKLWSAANLR